jgi:hypothetical protein
MEIWSVDIVFKYPVDVLSKAISEQVRDWYACIINTEITKLWVIILARYSACMGEKRNACWVMVRKYERKRSFGRPRYR